MELRQLEYFVTVANELHFARAAARMHVAQPSVSQQIKALEAELGVLLFERSSRGVTLTPAGSDLLPLASRLLSDAHRIQQHAQRSARRMAGRVRIGFLADEYANSTGERFIASIRREHPRLTVEFQQIDFAEQFTALSDGEVDVSFVMGPGPGSMVSVPLLSSPRLLAASRVNARPTQLEVEPSDFAGASVVMPNQMTDHAWRRDWTPPGSAATHVFVVGESSMEAMLSAVGAGRGVCVVPEYVSRFYPQPGVAFLPVAGLPPCSVEIAALRSRQAEPLIGAMMRVAEGLPARADR